MATFLVLLDQLIKGQVQFSLGLSEVPLRYSSINLFFLFFYLTLFFFGLIQFWKTALTSTLFKKLSLGFLMASGFTLFLDLYWMKTVFRHIEVWPSMALKINLGDIYLLVSVLLITVNLIKKSYINIFVMK
jgi:hypothetical protein